MSDLPPGYILDAAPPPAAGQDASLPAGYTLDAPAEPSTLSQIGRFALTAPVRALGGLVDFAVDPLASVRSLVSPKLAQMERKEGGAVAAPGSAAGDAVFNATGVPELKPTSLLGRAGLAATEGALAGGAFGAVPAALSALGGGAGQLVGDVTGSPRLATAAALAPGLLGKPIDAVGERFLPPETQATNLLARDVSRGASSGAPDVAAMQDALTQTPAGLTPKPLSLADVGGVNMQGRAEALANTPGPAAQTAETFLTNRDAGAGPRLLTDLNENLGAGPSAYRTGQALADQRATAAQPLYEKAFAGGSIAPLESTLTDFYNRASANSQQAARDLAAAQQAVTNAGAKNAVAGNVYSSSAALQAQREAAGQLKAAQQAVTEADQQKAAVLDRLQTAQQHAANGVPGAVWSPRIQQFLDDPIVQQGISKGLAVQRLESLAAGKKFDPTEYALVPDKDGNPTVSTVPNMRLLDAGKRGLDDILEQYRDPTTGVLRLDQYGRAVDQVRKAYLTELDSVNPDYAAARASYAGPSQSMGAIKQGANIFNMQPEQISDVIGNLAPGDLDFFKLGARDALAQRISKTSAGGNEALRLVGNQQTQNQLRPLFPDDQSFNNFINQAKIESLMYGTKANTLGNSRTARRAAFAAGEDEPAGGMLGSVLTAGGAALAHEPFAGIPALMRLGKSIAGHLKPPPPSPAVQQSLAQMLFSSDPAQNAATLNAISQVPGAAQIPLSLPAMLGAGQITTDRPR